MLILSGKCVNRGMSFFPAVRELKLNNHPFSAVDIFLSNELSAVFEHLDLIEHHNKSICVAQLGSCCTGPQYGHL